MYTSVFGSEHLLLVGHQAQQIRAQTMANFAAVLEDVDMIATPTVPTTAPIIQ